MRTDGVCWQMEAVTKVFFFSAEIGAVHIFTFSLAASTSSKNTGT